MQLLRELRKQGVPAAVTGYPDSRFFPLYRRLGPAISAGCLPRKYRRSVWPDGHKGRGFCRTDVRGGDRVGNEIETFENLYLEDSAAASFYIILRTRDFTKAFEDDISNN